MLVKLEAGGWVVAIDGAGPSNGPQQRAHGVLGQARECIAVLTWVDQQQRLRLQMDGFVALVPMAGRQVGVPAHVVD